MNNTTLQNCTLLVREYDRKKQLYIDTQYNMLFFIKEQSVTAVGFLLNGKITLLTYELKAIAYGQGIPISDTHFDDDSSVTKDNSSCVIC